MEHENISDIDKQINKFFNTFSPELKELINDWTSKNIDEIIQNPDSIWTDIPLCLFLTRELITITNDTEWSNKIATDIVYNSAGFINGLIEANDNIATMDIDNILPISLHASIIWQLKNGIIYDYLNNKEYLN